MKKIFLVFAMSALVGSSIYAMEENVGVDPKPAGCCDACLHAKTSGTPLHKASFLGHKECIKALVDAGAGVNVRNPLDGSTPLHYARNADCAKILIQGYMKQLLDSEDNAGRTALFRAVDKADKKRINLGFIEFLLGAGANVNARTGNYKQTPLHKAVTHGNIDVIRLLLQYNADVTIRDERGFSPIAVAVRIHCAKGKLGDCIALMQKYLPQGDDECPVCFESFKDISVDELSITPCCKRIMCIKCLNGIRGKGGVCPFCRNTDLWR